MIWTDEWIAIEAHRVAFLANGREAVAKIGMTMIRNELQAEIERLTAERDDLAGKLAAAQAEIEELSNRLTEAQRATIEASNAGIKLLAEAHQELHDLRIKAGLGEIGPDWAQAPEWANWWAMDADGWSYWYSHEPVAKRQRGQWESAIDSDSTRDAYNNAYWLQSLRQRPTGQPATGKESS